MPPALLETPAQTYFSSQGREVEMSPATTPNEGLRAYTGVSLGQMMYHLAIAEARVPRTAPRLYPVERVAPVTISESGRMSRYDD